MKEFVKLCDAKGKTLQEIVCDHLYEKVFLWNDNTYSRIHVDGYEDAGMDEDEHPLHSAPLRKFAVAYGIITEDEAKNWKHMEKVKKRMEKEKEERDLLAKLKAKYEEN
jgi:hypothetical protein